MLEIIRDIFLPILVSRVKNLRLECYFHNYFRSVISDSCVILSSDCLQLTATLPNCVPNHRVVSVSSVCDLTRGMTVKQHLASIQSIIPQNCVCVDHPVDDQTVNVWCQVPSHYLHLDHHVMYLVR